ncbi:MAG TPA: Ig-like domain-containing protein, partial [Gemmataceae bacterium]|nr:Ig-like domain-containing protein [Gemmataceae bacterium]
MFLNAFFSKRNTFLRAIKRQNKRPQRSWLEVQLLEDRCTPAGMTGQAIVTQAYQGLLDRAVDASGLATWGNFIDEGIPAAIAAVGIETATSQEFNEVLINQLYSTYIGRAPGASDAATWLGFLDSGGSYHEMVLLISSSDEAFTFAGGTNDTWLAALFTNALGRSIDSATQTQLDNLFTAGLNRAQIANIVLNTSEYYAHLVETSYQTLLDRPVDGPSLVFQVDALEAGFTYQDLLAGIVGSPEFASLASGPTMTTVTASTTTSVVSQPVTFTATVTPTTSNTGVPTGTVTFSDNGTSIGSGTLTSSGEATLTTSALTPGANTITAAYSGDSTFATSSGTTSVTVSTASTAITLTSSGNPIVFGQPFTLSSTVTVQSPGTGFASGTVTFTDKTSGTTLGTATVNAVTGVATLALDQTTTPPTPPLAIGSHTIVATYAPSAQGNFNASTSPTLTLVINQSNSTTTVTSSVTPSVFGQQVTFTATVAATSPGTGTPTGTVTFVDTTSGTTLGTGTLTSGTATLSVSSLTVASHTITANYGGDTNFSTSSGTTTQVVNQSATTTAVAPSVPTAVFGQSVTLTATVTPTAPGAGAPTGTVTFTDQHGNTLGTGTLNGSGQASATVSNLAVGSYTITASYAGDTNFSLSTGTAALTVNQSASTTTLTSDANPSVSGQTVDFTAIVTATAPGAGTPTGSVTFVDTTTGSTLGTITLDGTGKAVFTTSTLSIETHTIDANYSGDTDFTSSTGSVDQVVDPVGSTTTTIASSVNPSVAGQSVTFTVTVTSVQPGQGTPTGTVTFVDTTTGTTLGTGTLDGNGQATFTTSTLSTESHTIQANYGGDATFLASTASLDQVVDPVGSTNTSIGSSVNPTVAGQSVTFTATVTSVEAGQPTPTGTVTFVDTTTGTTLGTGTLNGTGQATFSTSSLAVGTNAIAANYGGDSTFLASSGSVSQTVNKAVTTTANVTSGSPSVSGQNVTFTATIAVTAPGAGTPTGLVTFVDSTTGATLGTSTVSTSADVTTATFSTTNL